MAQVVSRTCPTCGAPLPLKRGVSDVTCTYCNNSIHIEWAKRPPPDADPRTVYVPPQTNAAPLLVGVLLTGVVGIGIAAATINAATSTSSPVVLGVDKLQNVVGGGSEVSDFPVSCGLNQQLTIVDRTFEGPGPLITGNVNCKILIKNSTLKSDVIVLAKNLTGVTIENSTLEASRVAVEMEMNASVVAKAKSRLVGKEAALDSGPNGKLRLEDSTIEGGEVGVMAGLNFELDARNSKLTGSEAAIKGSSNLSVRARDSSLSGKRNGIAAETNLVVELRGGAVDAREAAIATTGYNAKLTLTHGAKLSAKETAIRGGGNLELTMDDARIEAGEVGVAAKNNAHLDLRNGSRISGKRAAATLEHNARVSLRDSTLHSSAGTALCGSHNAEIEARKSKLEGKTALAFARKPRKLELVETTPTGKQNFGSNTCP